MLPDQSYVHELLSREIFSLMSTRKVEFVRQKVLKVSIILYESGLEKPDDGPAQLIVFVIGCELF